MADKKDVRGYWCDKIYEKIQVVGKKIQCEHYRKSDLQTWCGMGRCADDCRVEYAIQRGEKPESYNDWLEDMIKVCNAAKKEVKATILYLNSKKVNDAIQRVQDFHAQMDKMPIRDD